MDDHPPPPATFRVEARKIVGYLLNADHPDGGSKARFFLSRGFSLKAVPQFAHRLLGHPGDSELSRVIRDAYALKYVYDGGLPCSDGSAPRVRTVWEMRAHETYGRLVTAYPSTQR